MEQGRFPGREECEEILVREAGGQSRILEHSRLVAAVAERLAEELSQAGNPVDSQLLWAAGCLHDIAKGRPRHAAAAADILRRLGWPAVAELVAVHMDVPLGGATPVTAAEVLYLADKLTEGSKVAGLARRFVAVGERYPDDPTAQRNIAARLRKAEQIQKKVEAATGRKIEELTAGLG
ncbi:MAG TPA: HD domain-containing protein [Patescibacteria group bacterium]|nr:HD domain-containing protein [Patescibacteria group bacterium]